MENGESREADQDAREDDRPADDEGRRHPDSGRDETEEERLDRNLGELLQELRVALPGVQVLFAFLLAVPFQKGFEEVTSFQKDVYFATLILTAISATMLISPSAYHRITFRYQQKRRLVYYANRFAIVGLAFLALAMTGAILLITDVLFSTAAAAVTAALALSFFSFFWFGIPLERRLKLSAGQEPLGKPEGD
jgi:VIT1/CCC1 family predicted Fe2+/Mn2+ transporter